MIVWYEKMNDSLIWKVKVDGSLIWKIIYLRKLSDAQISSFIEKESIMIFLKNMF